MYIKSQIVYITFKSSNLYDSLTESGISGAHSFVFHVVKINTYFNRHHDMTPPPFRQNNATPTLQFPPATLFKFENAGYEP